MLNRSLTRVANGGSAEDDIASGVSVAEEGLALVWVNDNGVAKLSPATGAGSDVFAGFSQSHDTLPTSLPYVGAVTASGTTLTLPFTPITGQIRLRDGAQVLAAGNPGTTANEYSIAGNVVTLHAGQADKVIAVTLRYAPTVSQARAIYGDGLPGAESNSAIQGRVSYIYRGVLYTSCFDASVAYTPGAAVKVAANGFVTSGGSGATTPFKVKSAPTAETPWLGLLND